MNGSTNPASLGRGYLDNGRRPGSCEPQALPLIKNVLPEMTPAQSRGWHSHRTAMVWTVPCRAISFWRLLSQKEAGLYLGWTDPVRWARRCHLGQCTNGGLETKGFVLNKLYFAIEVWWRKTDRVLMAYCVISHSRGERMQCILHLHRQIERQNTNRG